MNFQEVEFEITGVGVVASYHAGTGSNPGAAPNPVTQGWTATPAAPQLPNAFTPIASDFEPYVPLAETLPAGDVQFDSAQLNGRVDPRGSPAQGWFEWGEAPDYRNATSPVNLNGFGWRNLSENLNGLGSGQTYHYRAVASNDFVLAYGADQTLVTKQSVVIISNEVPVPGQFRVTFSGTPGTAYEALRSTDLITWMPIGEGVEISNGLFEFRDTSSPSTGAFYRIRSAIE